MPFCTKCGREVLITDRYCLNCGQIVDGGAAVSAPLITQSSTPQWSPQAPLIESESLGGASTLNYCPNCGAPLAVGQNFCRNCGTDLWQLAQSSQAEAKQPTTAIQGLASNSIVYLTPEGLRGALIRPSGVLLLSVVLPIPLLVATYLAIQEDTLAVYAVTWIILSLVIYDELRWQGFRRVEGNPSSASQPGRPSWFVPWSSIRMADWNGRTLWFTSANPPHRMSVTFDHNDAARIERSLASWGVRYSWKRPRLPSTLTSFFTLSLILFLTGQLILILAAVLPFFPGEAQIYSTILSNTKSQVAGATFIEAFKAIFLNNLQVAWSGMLPFLGGLSFGLANYNTGRVIQAIAIYYNYPPPVVLVSLYLLPHTWVEESAYPIATVAGVLAVTRWRSVSPSEFAHRVNWGSWKLVFSMVGVALILVAAGVIETAGLYLGAGELLFWIPVGAVIYLTITLSRTHRHAKPPSGSA